MYTMGWLDDTLESDVSFRFICRACKTQMREHSPMCPECGAQGQVFPRMRRPSNDYLPELRGKTAAELVRTGCKTFRLARWPALVLGASCLLLVAGLPGSGKTAMLLLLADLLRPSIVLPLEMGMGPLLSSYLQWLEVFSPDVRFEECDTLPDVYGLAATRGLRSFIVDSFTASSIQPGDALRLARAHDVVVAGSLQLLKDGSHAGSAQWGHAADVMLEVNSGRWRLTKSRFQQTGVEGEVQCSMDKVSAVPSA